jgi:HK97 family phage major capsid protein
MKGRPVIPTEYCSALGTAGDIALVDMSQYAISDRGDVRADSSIHLQFLTDEVAFRFLFEIDGQPTWRSALTPYQATAGRTLSAFVGLATRS